MATQQELGNGSNILMHCGTNIASNGHLQVKHMRHHQIHHLCKDIVDRRCYHMKQQQLGESCQEKNSFKFLIVTCV